MDDIFIMSQTQQEHRSLVRSILKQIQKVELRAKLLKCEFEKEELEILGYVISEKRVKPSPGHLTTV
jgi:hypothetical protein